MKQESLDKFVMDCYLDSPDEFKRNVFDGEGELAEIIANLFYKSNPRNFAFIDKDVFLHWVKKHENNKFDFTDKLSFTTDIYKAYSDKTDEWNKLANCIFNYQNKNTSPDEILKKMFEFRTASEFGHSILFYSIDYSKNEHPLTEIISKTSEQAKTKFFQDLTHEFYVYHNSQMYLGMASDIFDSDEPECLLKSYNVDVYNERLFQFLTDIKIENHNILLAPLETRKKISNHKYFKMTEIQKMIDKLDISDEIKSILLSLSKLKTKSKMYTALVLNDLGIKCKIPENDYVLSQLDSALKYGLIGKTDYEKLMLFFNDEPKKNLIMKVI